MKTLALLLALVTHEFPPAPAMELRALLAPEFTGVEIRPRGQTAPGDVYGLRELTSPPKRVVIDGTSVTLPPGAELRLGISVPPDRHPLYLFIEPIGTPAGSPMAWDRLRARLYFLRNGTSATRPEYGEFVAEARRDPRRAGQGYVLLAPVAAPEPVNRLHLKKNSNFVGITVGIHSVVAGWDARARPLPGRR